MREFELEWVVLIIFWIWSTVLKVAEKDVAARINFTFSSNDRSVVFSSSYVNVLVALFDPVEIIADFVEMIDVLIAAHSRREHKLPVLTTEPKSVIFSQDESEEFPMDNF